MGEAHVMTELQYQLLDDLPCEDKEEKLKRIVIEYSNYMLETRTMRENISKKIAEIISGKLPEKD